MEVGTDKWCVTTHLPHELVLKMNFAKQEGDSLLFCLKISEQAEDVKAEQKASCE